MAAVEEEHKCDCPPGAPGWLATFADLMSLLLTFFVLLLSFSEMDAQKFKKASGSIRLAFGVQREFIREDIPLGTSVVAEEYSQGEPTVLDFDLPPFVTSDRYALERRRYLMMQDDLQELFKQNKAFVEANMNQDIQDKLVAYSEQGFTIKLTFKESEVFLPSTDKLRREFVPVLKRLGRTVQEVKGRIKITGHTSKDFDKKVFRNEWELSSAQAARMGNILVEVTGIDTKWVEVSGKGASEPNKKASSESDHRRIEVEFVLNPKVLEEMEL